MKLGNECMIENDPAQQQGSSTISQDFLQSTADTMGAMDDTCMTRGCGPCHLADCVQWVCWSQQGFEKFLFH
jgi:hypothetical protein